MPLSEDRPQKTVRAVERTLNILFIVAGAPEPMGLAEISEASGLDKATTLRLLATIEAFRLVRRDETTRKYTIGAGAWQLASSSQAELKALAEIHLRVLRDRTEDRVVLVGHEPTMSALVERLCAPEAPRAFVELKKAGCALVEAPIRGDEPPGRGRLRWLLPPRVLRSLGEQR